MRQIVLDTETTGLEAAQGHRVIEIGCVELVNRRFTGSDFHRYVNPDGKEIEAGAMAVHGITMAKLADKPKFRELADELWNYLAGAELIIHNAAFDVGFLDKEFEPSGKPPLSQVCKITDTVAMARKLHPGQKVNLDALCKRYMVDNSHRDYHGAQLDAGLLAEVYLAMTGGQSALVLDAGAGAAGGARPSRFVDLLGQSDAPLRVIVATDDELQAHQARLALIKKKAGKVLWSEDLPAA